MNHRLPLFDVMERVWIERLWRALGPATRQEIVSILAEIARASMSGGGREARSRKAGQHAS